MSSLVAIVIAIFALVVVAGFMVYRQKGKVEIKGPFGLGLKFGGSNKSAQPEPGQAESEATNLKAGGGIKVNQTGTGTKKVDQVNAAGNIDISQTQDEPTSPAADLKKISLGPRLRE